MEKYSFSNLVLGNPTTCVFWFVIGKSNDHPVVITQFFIFNRLGTWVNVQDDVSHMFYGWKFSHFTYAPVMFLKGKHFLCVYYDITIFVWHAL